MDNSRSQTDFLGQETLIDELIQGMEVAKQLNATSSTETGDLMLQRILSSYETALMKLNSSGSTGVATAVVPDDDGFSWRKYGQKDVPGGNFPRSYYRCTYRNLEGCLATKQVQRSDEDPHVFEVTYRGVHTCKIARSSNASLPSDGDLDGVAKETKAPPFDSSKKRKTMLIWTDQVRVNPENELEKPLDDGFSWRKYGQKDVLGANFPRSYYRCTNRHLEGCLATKQVQRSDEDPHVFEVTYRGVHTCKIGQSSNASPPSDGDLDGVAKETKALPFDIWKKRKTMHIWTDQVRVNPENGLEGPHDDGFSWRKYGQKDVLGANFPRSYYRCANRHLEGCLAIKQVQRSDKNHDVFEVTYRGKHTCKIARTNPSQQENREDMSTITFSEPAGPQEIMACGEHLDTSQETTDISSFNFFTDFFQQTTTSCRAISSSITDHHHQDNNDFCGSFSPSFTSPSTSAADNFCFEDGHDSYGSPNSELSNTVNGCTSFAHQTAINELILGMEVAKQLRLQLNATSSIETRDLIQQIVSSHEKALMILNCSGSIGAQPHDAAVATAVVPGSPRSPNASPPSDGDLDGVVKENQAEYELVKIRRRDRFGLHSFFCQSSNASPPSDGDLDGVAKETKALPFDIWKKRKTMHIWTDQVRVNPENGLEGPHDDGFSWRKYGQKDVLGANFPRSYYRCANRHLEGCLAIKQVQRSDKNHDVFEVTYRGKHTCKIARTNPSQQENREDMSTITFSEPAGPQEIMACGEHLDTSQETTDISSFNFFTDFFQQTTTSCRAISSSITDHHHQDNNDFCGSFSPSFTSPSTSAADNFCFEDGHDSYGSPNSELSNTVNGCTSFAHQTAINELILGMEVAKQLRLQLNATSSIETRDLIQQIVSSHEKALMILNCSGSIGAQPHDAAVATAVVPGSPRSPNASPPSDGDLDGVVKENQAEYELVKIRRRDRFGLHSFFCQSSNASPPSDGDLDGVAKETKALPFDIWKKRKTMHIWTDQVRVNPENGLEGPHDDGFSWRKYGQKDVLGANFPRSYYRCANRHLEGCLAIKQVQRSDKNHDVFEVTYRGKHTCKIARTNPSQQENREDMSTITFSEPAGPQEIMACGEHLDTSQETTDISSFNFFTDFFQQTTTSCRAISSSITDHHHQDNNDFCGSFSPSFTSPSTSAADNFCFEDGHDSYGSPNSELSNTVNGCTSFAHQTAINELILGMEVAKQLRLQLNATSSIETRDLIQQIVSSHEKALMILNCSGSIGAQPHDAAVATAVVPGSPRSPNASPPSDGDLDGVVKENQASPFDTSKKRKTMPRWTYQVRVNPENGLEGPHDDGFSWSKYGQKDILGAAFPRSRSYYRCTYRNLEGCLATKKEQRSDEDPYVIEGTYCGRHTCEIAQTDPSKPEIQEQRISTITFSELAKPQETTVVPSFNSIIHFLKETTTSSRDSTSSIIDHHRHRDNKDFRGSFSPSFESPSASAADDSFFGDGYQSYGNPDSELNNILNGDRGIRISTGADEDLVNCRRLATLHLKTVDLLLLLIPSISTALNLRAECLVKVYLPGSNDALVQDLVNLKQLDLSCSSFTRIPDLSRACKLQSLDLHCCNNLVDVSFLQYLAKLEHINLKGCTSLARLPSLMALKLLLSLDLSDCINLRGLPPSVGCLSSLAALDLSNCKRIRNLPKGILRLKSVQTLSISGCSMLIEQASGPDGMLIENQVNPIAHSSSHASDEEVSMSYLPVDKYVPKIPLQQPEEERIISKYHSMASKGAAEPSSTTQDLELHKEVLKAYMNMPVEKIHQANAFYDVQRTVDSLTQQSHESASLHDLMYCLEEHDLTYCLEELKENVPETMSRLHDARVSRASIQVKLAHLHSSFVQSEGHYNGLSARLSVISDEEEDLDAEIDRLLAKRRELLD